MLYRFDKKDNEWKTRGKGTIKMMQHKDTKQIRMVMREGLTLKLRMNHNIHPTIELKPNQGSEKSWTWATTDYAGEEPVEQTFAVRFKSPELAMEFKSKHDVARGLNGSSSKPAPAASVTAVEKKEDNIEEDCSAEYKPVVVLSEVATLSGEEGETLFFEG